MLAVFNSAEILACAIDSVIKSLSSELGLNESDIKEALESVKSQRTACDDDRQLLLPFEELKSSNRKRSQNNA